MRWVARSSMRRYFAHGSAQMLDVPPQQLQELLGLKSTLVRISVSEPLVSSTIGVVKRASIPLTSAVETLGDLLGPT